MSASFIIAIAIVVLLFVVLQRKQGGRKQGRSLYYRERVRQLNRLLAQTVEEPDYPNLRSQRSKNENSKEFQEILKALRQSHPHKSEAWRWDEAHRQMGRGQ